MSTSLSLMTALFCPASLLLGRRTVCVLRGTCTHSSHRSFACCPHRSNVCMRRKSIAEQYTTFNKNSRWDPDLLQSVHSLSYDALLRVQCISFGVQRQDYPNIWQFPSYLNFRFQTFLANLVATQTRIEVFWRIAVAELRGYLCWLSYGQEVSKTRRYRSTYPDMIGPTYRRI